jgi:hypothetical protein
LLMAIKRRIPAARMRVRAMRRKVERFMEPREGNGWRSKGAFERHRSGVGLAILRHGGRGVNWELI